ncbi:PspC domain-containing protein [Candidatus Saccharibacteria bacterium]|nr:PspC domain-containing protein [Candidatus Saccharibacteria bacterium]
MKEITRIHLAATPYNIELAAKKDLEKYITSIENVLAADDETVREIEARMIELLAERGVKDEQVITAADVAALKERLGAPGEFVDEPIEEATPDKKRLLRDEQKGMVGGVLAGIAAYTGVDVTWYRVAAIILAFMSFGTMFIVYAVLWIAIPPARTAAERLQMRGKQMTLKNIQDESSAEVRDVSSYKKPLVVILRIIGILCLLGIVFVAIAILAAALFAGVPMFSLASWLTNGWLIAALLVGSLSGILLVILMGMAIYMLAAWRAPKTLIILSGVVIVAGLVAFGTSAGTAIYGAQQMKAAIDENTTTRRETLPQLGGATVLRIEKTSTPVTYKTVVGEPYAEVRTFQRDKTTRLPLKMIRDGETAVLQVGELPKQECAEWIDYCTLENASVTVYGPSLSMLDVVGATVAYETDATQQILKTTIRDDATLRLAGRFGAIDMAGRNGTLHASDAAIDDVTLRLEDNSDVAVGVVRTLSVEAPASCGVDSKSGVTYERATNMLVNGAQYSGVSTACLTLESTQEIGTPEA